MFIVERRDRNGTWYRWSIGGSEYSATHVAENAKSSYPDSQFRVLDERGGVRYII
jgi:hypothetical protein